MERAPEQRGIAVHTETITEELGKRTLELAAASPEELENRPSLLEGLDSDMTPEELRLCDKFTRLAHKVALSYHTPEDGETELEDKIGDAKEGLIVAAQRFNQKKKTDTSHTGYSFFRETIRGKVLDGMKERYGIDNNHENPADNNPDKIARNKPSVVYDTAKSLDQPLPDSDTSLHEIIGFEASADESLPVDLEEARQAIAESLGNFSEEENRVFNLFHLQEKPKTQIAAEIDMTPKRVSGLLQQIEEDIQSRYERKAA